MNIKCLFGHKWLYLSITPYVDTSFGSRVRSVAYTRKCQRCGRVHCGHLYGSEVTLEELNSKP